MAKPSSNLRLFVAAYPPLEVCQAMVEAVKALDLPPHRLVPVEQVHLTLLFVGDTPASEMDDTIESVRRAAAGLSSFQMTPHRLITLPERGPARLIAAEADAHPTLLEIHRRLVTRLARKVREKEKDRFRPHFTLTRFRSPAHRLRIEQPLEVAALEVSRIELMRSTLSSQGAEHHEVAACELVR
jgi:RNA 2',3'-cyclic 3'-phosphodiesterase